MLHLLAVVTLSLYFAASMLFLLSVSGIRRGWSGVGRALTIAALLLHTTLLLPMFSEYSSVIPESRGQYVFWLSWTLAMSYFLLGKKADYAIIGAFVAPCTAFLFTASSYLSHLGKFQPAGNPSRLMLLTHVLPALLAELSLFIAFIIGCSYLIQAGRIKRKSAEALLHRGPSLDTLEKASRKVLYAGFICMTVAIISGTFWAVERAYSPAPSDFYQLLAFAVWIILGFLLHVKVNLHWSAKRCARLTVITTGLLMLTMFFIFCSQGNIIHSYGS